MSVATFAAAQLLRALPRTQVSRAVGRLCDAELPPAISQAIVSLYVRAYQVDLDECAPPLGPYRSFDAFFTRKLRPGMRQIDRSENDLVSPADGRIEAIGTIDTRGTLLVKQRPYTVAELLGNAAEAARYEGGQFAVVYLSPRDYHRVHSPVDGTIALVRSMAGDQYPVNSIGERHVPSLFAKNKRVAIAIDTERLGRVTAVMVGAMIVGRISVSVLPYPSVPTGPHLLDPPRSVGQGEEIGIFHLGSTVIVFVEAGVTSPWRRPIGPIRLGQSLVGVP